MRRRRTANCGKDLKGLLVAPIVNHLHDHVSVANRQCVLEEIPSLKLEARIGHKVLYDMRPIEQHTCRVGRGLQYCPEQVTAAASDVGNGFEAREVVVGEDTCDLAMSLTRHGFVEQF